MTFTKADTRRPAADRTIPEFREYRVTHSIEPDYERYGADAPTKFYGDRVTTWAGHIFALCPSCGTVNAVGRLAFQKHEPELALADEADFLQWATRWLDKRHTAKQTAQ